MNFLRAEDQRLVPWKNGCGVTREVAVYSDKGMGPEFLWRVSIAIVNKDGPFSIFEGVDRTIAVMHGDGIILHSGGNSVSLTPTSEPHAFKGELPVEASVMESQTTDLNVMSRRECFDHSMERLVLKNTVAIDGEADETLIVFNGPMSAKLPAGLFSARQFDAITGIGRGSRVYLFPEGESEVFVIRVSAKPLSR
ncbi:MULTISPECIES: HutD family protein [unclassified Rhizobium]|uniref:HutD/Ves family protein n=1 Tax=unclassified Rhizobium TaxID=2613769 RepID=UPI000A7ABBAD|nr:MULTISPECIES: HutD family protein [unclassified Rhizobium]